jgi:hemerythrin-like domain-containing protein
MATAKTSTTTARDDIVEMLKDDHKRAKKAFKDFEKLDPESDAEECEALARQTCAELTLHATLEEECLYPAMRQSLDDSELVDEAEVEHQSAKDLIAKLEDMAVEDPKFAATFKVLGEYVEHHVKEEEGEMLPKFSRAKEVDWQALCDEMNSRRAELAEALLPDEAVEDEAGATSARSAASPSQAGQRSAARSAGTAARPQAKKSSDDRR